MKNTYKELYDEIRPDEKLVDSVFEIRDRKKKKHLAPKIVSAVLALAIIIGGGSYGVRQIQIYKNPYETKTLPTVTYSGSNQSNENYGFIMVVNAAESENENDTSIDFSRQSADLNTLYEDSMMIKCISTKGMTDYEKKQALSNLEDELFYSADSWVYTKKIKNAYVGYSVADYFRFSVPNAEQVEEIRVSHSDKYGVMTMISDDCSYDDNNVVHHEYQFEDGYDELYEMTGNNLAFPGNRFLKNAKLKEGPRYFYNTEDKVYVQFTDYYDGLMIYWIPSDVLFDAFETNPNMDLTKIKDTITFEVEFKNGDVARSVAEIWFDSDGMMNEKLVSFDYIKNGQN